jgi:hypothetical protein
MPGRNTIPRGGRSYVCVGSDEPLIGETVGPPIPHTEVKIISPETGRTVPVGVQGELGLEEDAGIETA